MNSFNLVDKNLYYVGGVVRDEILGLDSFDVDITYQGDAIEFAKSLENVEILQINPDFGTVRIKLENNEIDIASTRDEEYPKKGHLPVVKNIGCDLKADVERRDFTINTLAKSTLSGEIIDYLGGIDDIKSKKLRVLHDESFIDDPTRIVRGLKFSVRFGFKLENHTKILQQQYLSNVNYDMSYKRLKKELVETFNLNSYKAFKIFVKDNIYKLLTDKDFELPEYDFSKLITEYMPNNIWLCYVGLLPEVFKLPLTKVEMKIVEDYNKLKILSYNSDFKIYKNFSSVSLESVIMYSTIDSNVVNHYLENLSDINISMKGIDIIALGIKPSSKYQECFDYILTKKLANPNLTKSEELELAKEFFSF